MDPKVIEENVDEISILCENTITEEIKIAKDVMERGLTRDEVITILTQRIIDLSKKKTLDCT